MSKSVPNRPNLEFDRKQAKALLSALEAHEITAHARFEQFHPRGIPKKPKLADAQLVVAREYGFASWPQWKVFVETRQLDRKRQAAIVLRSVCSNDLPRARVLLHADPELEREDFYNACAGGLLSVVQAALERDPALATRKGGVDDWTPLEYACYSRWLRVDEDRAERIVQIVRLLLEHGADANAWHSSGSGDEFDKQVALFGAAGIANNVALTRMLLAAGADVDEGFPAPDPKNYHGVPWGTEALYHASEFHDATCLELLLAAKPHPLRVNYCLARALDFENPAAVRAYLKHGADANFGFRGEPYLHRAIKAGRSLAVVECLLEAGADPRKTDREGRTAYQCAVRDGQRDVAEALDAKGFGGPVADEDAILGRLVLGEIHPDLASVPADLLNKAAYHDDCETIRALVQAGADINAMHDGMAPIHQAAWRGHGSAARLLVDLGADIERRNSYGGTALGTCLHGSENCFDAEGGPGMMLPEEIAHGDYPGIVEYLIEHGAELPSTITDGSQAVREILRRHGVPDRD